MNLPMVKTDLYPVYDVIVVGGGMAGIGAAIAAARGGAKTLLIEKAGWLGGMGITGATGLHSFYNIFGQYPGSERLRVVAGIAQELVDRAQAMGGGVGHVLMERGLSFLSMITPVEPEVFKLAAIRLCQEAGVKLLFHTVLDEIQADTGHIEGLVLWNKAGRSLVRARQYIDCSGDGDLAAYAGAPFLQFKLGDPGAYAAGFTFRLCNVDLDRMEASLEQRGLILHLAHAVKPGMDKPDLIRLGFEMRPFREAGIEYAPDWFMASSLRPRELTYCNCINYGPNDGLDADALSNAEIYLRGRMLDTAEFFRQNIAGCEASYIAGPAPSAGQRRGRAIRCEYELTQEDCVQARQFDDQIGCFSFIDNSRDRVRDALAYGIPFRALIPKDVDNLLVAGRMISVDLSAHNSTRNTVCCLICGQAAGTAASLAASQRIAPRDVDRQMLRERLRQSGVLLQPYPDPLPA
jgi:FAD dependent oxidoreductase